MGKFNKDPEKLTLGLINSDDENSSCFIDPTLTDPLYNPKGGRLAMKGKTLIAVGDDEMSTYSVYNKS